MTYIQVNFQEVKLLSLHCDTRKNILIRHHFKCLLMLIVEYLIPNQELAKLRLCSCNLTILEAVEVDVVLQDHIYLIHPFNVIIQHFTLLLFL